jgi:hypothetical protein
LSRWNVRIAQIIANELFIEILLVAHYKRRGSRKPGEFQPKAGREVSSLGKRRPGKFTGQKGS